jgi:hypothetical protein
MRLRCGPPGTSGSRQWNDPSRCRA